MSIGVPMAPAGMNAVPGVGMDPTAVAGLGMTPGLGLGGPPGLAAGPSAGMGLGAPAAGLGAPAAATAAAPPIATECLLISNLFDENKLANYFIYNSPFYTVTLQWTGKPC